MFPNRVTSADARPSLVSQHIGSRPIRVAFLLSLAWFTFVVWACFRQAICHSTWCPGGRCKCVDAKCHFSAHKGPERARKGNEYHIGGEVLTASHGIAACTRAAEANAHTTQPSGRRYPRERERESDKSPTALSALNRLSAGQQRPVSGLSFGSASVSSINPASVLRQRKSKKTSCRWVSECSSCTCMTQRGEKPSREDTSPSSDVTEHREATAAAHTDPIACVRAHCLATAPAMMRSIAFLRFSTKF